MSFFDLFRSKSKKSEKKGDESLIVRTNDQTGSLSTLSFPRSVKADDNTITGLPRLKNPLPVNVNGVRTIFVFLNVPRHIEINAGYLPLIEEGTEVHFELNFRMLKNPSSTKDITGTYIVDRRILRWSTSKPSRTGLTQYLEWRLVSQS